MAANMITFLFFGTLEETNPPNPAITISTIKNKAVLLDMIIVSHLVSSTEPVAMILAFQDSKTLRGTKMISR